jgi:hypothetical protein
MHARLAAKWQKYGVLHSKARPVLALALAGAALAAPTRSKLLQQQSRQQQ